ncbi:MAG: hypothetical protein U5L75_01505 [Candidatus Campbellbacteria bacterium]|nr:hypothetical protein [Candidatus Campbellbacteria bacterium]
MTEQQYKLYECSECHLKYKQKELAEKSEAWCQEHQSCNLEIIDHAVRVVLFACAENKKRSQMAEVILDRFATRAIAKSAGTMPAAARWSRDWEQFLAEMGRCRTAGIACP